ncbi:hypothetical protein MPH_13515 [Macrophomina phaseolina MS6]|uniref:Protein kinase domain-containing protein n=1 Tax=Macrophomina phaseolina (strain MS6) TaxID=1126212 RepID=K2RH83_MACPH|nr:hypothetical protein MPH_13515 [Macrophomina phaseolina MS6]
MEAELERLRRQLQEEQQRREEAEAEREEAKARAAAEERQRKEEQRQREEAEAKAIAEQQRREEEQQRREKAEAINRRTTLTEFLQACHEIFLSLRITDDETLTTQGDVTKPAGRLYPNQIIPWDTFPTYQSEIWAELSASPAFASNRVFASTHQLDHIRTTMDPIDSEELLRHFARSAVEKPVQNIVDEIFNDGTLREKLGLRGRVSFQSHTNLGQSDATTVDEAMERMSISDTSRGNQRATSARPATSERRGKGGGRADQFCIYRQEDGSSSPAIAIEYKAPHKLTRGAITAGLSGTIVPGRDVINKEGNSVEFFSKWLLAAVVTQCFSYMIDKGVQYGYLFTGDAIVFLHIPNDPVTVHYYVSIPGVDAQKDDEYGVQRTAVAQISAFVLRALAAPPPPQEWQRIARRSLDTWVVEYIDVLKKIPETERKKTRETFSYQPSRWIASSGSRVKTRSQCLPIDDQAGAQRDDDDDDAGDGDGWGHSMAPSPTPQRKTRSQTGQGSSRRRQGEKRSAAGKGTSRAATTAAAKPTTPKPRLEDRPYCTHECLLGLVRGGPLDQHCPNVQFHRKTHIKPDTFLRLVRRQLLTDIGVDADCKPLYVRGSRGALFKVRLSSHGYTLVAKGMEEHNARHLRHESCMYQHASAAQGRAVPVCIGLTDLEIPYFYDGGAYKHMLFLSWAGRPLFKFINQDNKVALLERAKATLGQLHGLGLLHNDAEMRNVLWDERTGGLMWTDLERAEGRARRPLGEICPNRKRNRTACKLISGSNDEFSREMMLLSAHVARSVR